MQLFQELNTEGVTIILVTHEDEVARYAKRVVELRDGQIIKDITQEPDSAAEDLRDLLARREAAQEADTAGVDAAETTANQ
jgi:putative ABC transport system ATP-binding protein